MTSDADTLQSARDHFQIGFRDLYLRDITVANDADVRMGTFVLCAAFLDALALSYSAGMKVKGSKSGKWSRFVTDYLSDEYLFLRGAYASFRSKLLHNYSADGIIFTHGEGRAHLHCHVDADGRAWMHRESLVRDVTAAFVSFERDVLADAALRARVVAHWERYPPMGLAIRITRATGEVK